MNSIIESDCAAILRRVDLAKLRRKKVLITGASGFLGQYLAHALAYANRDKKLGVRITLVGLRPAPALIGPLVKSDGNITYKRVDLTKPFKLRGYDYIFHAAGYGQPAKFTADPLSVVKVNVDATASLLTASPRATFVFFSSAEVYGDVPKELLPVREDYNGNSPMHSPRSVYAEAKRLGEALCTSLGANCGVKTKIVRISHIYGPGLPRDDRRVMSEFIRKALVEKKISLLDSGDAVKTYGYIADATAMILHVALHGKQPVYNVGGTDRISIRQLAEKIAAYCDVPVTIPHVPVKARHVGKDPAVVQLDLTKLRKEIRRMKFVPFAEGLTRTVEWSRSLM